ncbi:unnamed protein product [Peniophora sp. CBMAI 1063]|nr:unnamed protein product [Peniophora sp. CBMAI 1063]
MLVTRRIVSWPPSNKRWWVRYKNIERDDRYQEAGLLHYELLEKARHIFRGPADLSRLRSASGWVVSSTPRWATYKEFAQGHGAFWGISAEAMALVLYHMSTYEHASAAEIERYWLAVDYWFENVAEEPYDEGLWHNDDGEWRGNPATADVVFRAVNHAHDLDADIEPSVRKASRRAYLEEVARQKAREQARKARLQEYVEV